MFFIHVGTGKWAEVFNTTQIGLSIASIIEYTTSHIAPQSLFQDLLLETYNDDNNNGIGQERLCWELQLLWDPKGDKSVTKYGKHSNKFAVHLSRDGTLQDLGKSRQGIHIQIVFNETKFDEWEQRQLTKEEIPMATIVGNSEDSKHLKIEIDYPRKKIYQVPWIR